MNQDDHRRGVDRESALKAASLRARARSERRLRHHCPCGSGANDEKRGEFLSLSPIIRFTGTSPMVAFQAQIGTQTLSEHHRAVSKGGRTRVFTLMEILIAVAIFTMVAVVMLGFARQISSSYGRLVREHARFHELLALDRALDSILSNAIPFVWPNEEGEMVHFFVGDENRVDLAYLHARTTWNEGAIRFASLAVDDGLLTCVYAARPYLGDEPPEEGRRVTVLARGVKTLELQYADYRGGDDGEWSDRLVWTKVWPEDRTELPLAILVYIEWEDGRKESWLRRTAGSGYRERIAPWDPPKEGR